MNYNKSITATVYVVNNDKVLLHQHKKYKTWFPLGGHVEVNEFPHEAAIREVKEESGLDVKLVETEIAPSIELARVKRIPAPFCLLHEGIGGDENFFDFIYIAETIETIPSPESGESKDFKWFSYEELKENDIKPHVKNTAIAVLKYLQEKEGSLVMEQDLNTSSMWDDFRFIDLFAGIGGIRLGFESVGGQCVFSSEFDEDACTTYKANFGEHPAGDITKIDAKDIPDFDVLLGGFPCQAFSIIGKKEGFANETCGTLFFDIERILKEKRPKAFMLENVRNLTAHDGGNTFKTIKEHLEALGYHVHAKVLNALDFGPPQKRERIIIVGFLDDVDFEFPEPIPIEERLTLEDVLENNVDSKYYVKPHIRDSRLARLKDPNYPKPYISHENMAGSVTPHPYSSALRAGASANYILINDERRPTEREMLRIQGFPDTFRIVVPYGKMKKQCGNSVAVPVIRAVAKQMVKALKDYENKE